MVRITRFSRGRWGYGMSINPIQTGLLFAFLIAGGLRRPSTCNSITAYGMAAKVTEIVM